MRFSTLVFGTSLVAVCCASRVHAETYYVAVDGDDKAPGTEAAPFASWAQAQSAAAPGDTVYFRGGRYRYTAATTDCGGRTSAIVNAVVLSKSGAPDKPIRYWAYPNERPVFDFSGLTDMSKYNCRQTGVRVLASYLHLKGLEFTGALQLNNLNHESWCVYVYGGSHNLFELLDAHHNMGPGFFIQRGSHNTFLNCDSHENEDTLTSNGDGQSADGFGCHPNRAGDTGNVFRGCRAWWNTDDGWDFIHASEACTVEHSWSWYNGYKPDALQGGKPVSLPAGNGNGFKGGGYGLPPTNVPPMTPQHTLRFNLSVANKSSGFYANHSPNSPIFYNNTAYKNGANYNMTGVGPDGSSQISVGVLRNNIAFGGTATSNANLGGPIDSANNSWDAKPSITVTKADFQSVEFNPPAACPATYTPGGTVCVPPTDTKSFGGLASARQADGSLPVVPLFHLAAGSPLIDRGVDVGLPSVGKAPDLGAFESGADEHATSGSAGSSSAGNGAAGSNGAAGNGAAGALAGSSSAAGVGGTVAAASSNSAGAFSSASAGKAGSTQTERGGAAITPGSAGTTTGAGRLEMGALAAGSGTAPQAEPASANQAGCSCQLARRRSNDGLSATFVAALAALALRRRRAQRGTRT